MGTRYSPAALLRRADRGEGRGAAAARWQMAASNLKASLQQRKERLQEDGDREVAALERRLSTQKAELEASLQVSGAAVRVAPRGG